MKKTIKYLQGGEYHEATVADVGDIDLLKTETKTDLVSAINEIFVTGGQGSGKPDGYDELVEKVEVINSNTNDNSEDIANAVAELEKAKKEIIQTAKEIQNAKNQALIEAQKAAQKAVNEYNEARQKLDEELSKAQEQLANDIESKQNDIDKLNEKASNLTTQLTTVKDNAEKTAQELSNAKLDLGTTRKEIKNLENEVSQKLSNTDITPLKEKVESVSSEVKQTRDAVTLKADRKDLDLLTGNVDDIKSQLKVASDRIESKVSRDTLEKNINDFQVKKANLLTGTRDFLDIDFNNRGLARVSSETYSHARIAVLDDGGTIILKGRNLSLGESYTLSINARVNTGIAQIKVNNFGEMKKVDTKDSNVNTQWLRYSITFVATKEAMDLEIRGVGLGNNMQLYLNKAKLEKGAVPYSWEPNENDVYERIEHTEAKFTVYDDQISGVVKKQTDFADKQTQMQTTLNTVAEGVTANSQLIEKTKDGLVKDFEGKLSASAKQLTSEYTAKTNEAIGQITDSGANLILNSAFQNPDDRLSKWQEISSKANIAAGNDGLYWINLSQSGLTKDNPVSIKSNYFSVKKGKLTVAVEFKLNVVPDNKTVIVVEFYNTNNQRVDFKNFTLNDLGVNISNFGRQRGMARVGIDRTDVAKASVKAILMRNGNLSFTNFLAKNSSVDDGAYVASPEDVGEQIIKQNTKIEQNAEAIKLKSDKTEVTNKLTDLNNKLRQEITTQKEAVLKVSSDGIEQMTRKVETVQNLANTANNTAGSAKNTANNAQNAATNAQKSANKAQATADNANANLGAYQKVTETTFKNLGDRITSEVSSVKSTVDNLQIGGANLLTNTSQEAHEVAIPTSSYQEGAVYVTTQPLNDTKYTLSFEARADQSNQYIENFFYNHGLGGKNGVTKSVGSNGDVTTTVGGDGKYNIKLTTNWEKYWVIYDFVPDNTRKGVIVGRRAKSSNPAGKVYVRKVKLESGNKATDYTPAIEDTQGQINSNKQAIESANSKLTQVENGFQATANKIQSDLNGKITKNTNDIKAFDDKYSRELTTVKTDLNTKATQQWAQNKIEETANSVRRTIESVDSKISTLGSPNIVANGYNPQNTSGWYDWTKISTHPFYYNGSRNLFELANSSPDEKIARTDDSRFKLKRNTKYSISFMGFAATNVKSMDVYVLGRRNGEVEGYTKIVCPISTKKLPADRAEYVTTTFDSGDMDEAYLRFDNNGSSDGKSASLFIGEIMLCEGNPRHWAPTYSEYVDNLQIGGVNKLQGTADFSWKNGIGEFNNPNTSIENYSTTIKMAHIHSSIDGGIYTKWGNAFPDGELQVGDRYTLSFDAKGNGTFLAIGNESSGQASKNALVGSNITNNWKRYSVSGTITNLGKSFVFYFKGGYNVYLKQVKIELGDKATPWSPAPEDVQGQININKQAIEYNKHKLEETDKKLESQFSTITDYGNRLKSAESKITQTADSWNVRVTSLQNDVNSKVNDLKSNISSLQVGGTNLLEGTSFDPKSNDAPASGWVEGAVYNTINPLTERKYVLSFEARGDVDRQTIGTFLWSGGLGGGNIARSSVSSDGHTSTSGDGNTSVTLSTNWKKYWVNYEVTPDNTRKSAIVGRRWSDSKPSGKVYIRKVKLESGEKATDYSPAPEDIQGQINSNKQAVQDNTNKISTLTTNMTSVIQKADGIESTVSRVVTESLKNSGESQNLVYNSEFNNNCEGWTNIGTNTNGSIAFSNNQYDNWHGSNGLAFRNINKSLVVIASESKPFSLGSWGTLSAGVQMHVTDTITQDCGVGMEIRFYADEAKKQFIKKSETSTQQVSGVKNGHQQFLYCNNVSIPSNARYASMCLWVYKIGNIIFNQPMISVGSSVQPYKQDNKSVQDSMSNLNSAITTVKQTADSWNVRVTSLQNDVNSKVNDLKSNIGNVQNDINGKINNVKDNIGNVQNNLQGQINNRVEKNRVITEINADASGVRISGNKNHITGETVIDNGVIKSAHIDKLDANKINGIEFSSGENFYSKWENRTRSPMVMNDTGIYTASSYVANLNDNVAWSFPLGHIDTGNNYNNNCVTVAHIYQKGQSGKQLKDGDIIIISAQINYDNAKGDSKTTALAQFGRAPEWDNPFNEMMGSYNRKGVVTGNYWYTWKFKWKSSYGSQGIPLQIRFDNLNSGTHVNITSAKSWSALTGDNGNNGYREAAFELTNDGQFRGTYLEKVDANPLNTMDILEWHEGQLRFAHGQEGAYPYPFGEVIINGNGINIFGQADRTERRFTFWGSASHEEMVNSGGVTGDYDSLANGTWFDSYGNIHMSKKSAHFCVTNSSGVDIMKTENQGEARLWMNNGYVQNHFGLGSAGFIDASNNGNVFFNRNGNAGYVFNSDVNVGGWLGCNSFSNRSQLSIKKDVEKVDESNLASKLLGIDIGTWRYKTESADDIRHIGAVIDDVNDDKKWLIPSEFLSKDGKSVLPLNLIGGLIATVKQQSKQISDMNLKLLSLELKGNGLKDSE